MKASLVLMDWILNEQITIMVIMVFEITLSEYHLAKSLKPGKADPKRLT